MSKNNLRFRPLLNGNVNELKAHQAPSLLVRANDTMPLNAKDVKAKIYFMSNCGISFDLKNQKFTNMINDNDPIIRECFDRIVKNPGCLADNCQNIRMNNRNAERLKIVLGKYLSTNIINDFSDDVWESRVVTTSFKPMFRDGPFRAFSIHGFIRENAGKVGQHILYIVFYDPYHLIFPHSDSSYSSKVGYLGSNLTTIFDRYHSSIDKNLIKEFEGLMSYSKKSNS